MKFRVLFFALLLLSSSLSAAVTEDTTEVKKTAPAKEDRVEVYYFHGSRRCASCIKIEKYTEEAVMNHFPGLLESGELVYRAVNTDKEKNEHFIEDYQLYTKSVILSLVKGGEEVKYKNLSKVWQYLRDRERFDEYIREETEQFLAELGDREKGSS